MSYGSISAEAHETLAIAMNRLGGRSNSGEGGESVHRFDRTRTATGAAAPSSRWPRAGSASPVHYLTNCTDIQIKMAQGAKPGEGGQLPGHKVYPWVAEVRHSTPGVGLISPPPHHDIYSIEDLAQLIHDLKNANPSARVHVKLVSENGVGTVAAGVSKAHADVVLISGHDGGTGATPLTSQKHAGAPWELGLAETQQTLLLNGLRDRIVVQVDGQLKTGRDVVVAALLGAEEFGFATAPLVVAGCIMMRVCHLDTCPVGVATQNPVLRERFNAKPEFVENFFLFIAEEVRELMAQLGFRTVNEMVGQVGTLDTTQAAEHWKAHKLDLSPVLYEPESAFMNQDLYCSSRQDHGLDKALDQQLIAQCREALDTGATVRFSTTIANVNRTVGTMLGHEVTKVHGGQGLPDGTIDITFDGSAGNSFGAFVPKGITLRVYGDANDYVGKGLSGGRLVVRPSEDAPEDYVAEDNIIGGNVILFGATSGQAFLRGVVGERFAVRNSGAHAVVEGVGDHGCEYMTGGKVVILGPDRPQLRRGHVGRHRLRVRPAAACCPTTSTPRWSNWRRSTTMTSNGCATCSSRTSTPPIRLVAQRILADWEVELKHFVKVMPRDYKRVLAAIAEAERNRRGRRRPRSWRPQVADPRGFLKITHRETPQRRPVPLRLRDWKEVYEDFSHDVLKDQAARCMDCGIPFCHNGCPLGNLIPEWNDLVYQRPLARFDRAAARHQQLPGVHRTVVPGAVRGLVRARHQPGSGDHQAGRGRDHRQRLRRGLGGPAAAGQADRQEGRGRRIGTRGPGRRAAAHPGRSRGDGVRAGRPHRRAAALRHPRVQDGEAPHRPPAGADGGRGHRRSAPGVNVGVDITAAQLRSEYDAVVLAGGATEARDLPIPGRELDGIHQAMEYLPWANRVQQGDEVLDEHGQPPITAKDKKVVIIGGGDTGADCLGTAHRQGAASVHQFEIMPRPPETGPTRRRGRPTR